jgi:hypothetical protein
MTSATSRGFRIALLAVICSIFIATTAPAAAPAAAAASDPTDDRLGWSKTNHAGRAAGEIGGTVRTAAAPLFYADKIAPKSLAEKLTASGSIVLPAQPASKAAVFIGWFNADFRGWRFPTCVGFFVSGDADPNDVLFTYALNGTWNLARGAAATTFRIPRDGTRHKWTITYDPKANGGNSTVTLAVDGQPPFVADLPSGHMPAGATVDRFGVLQAQAAGNPFTVYLDDVEYDGATTAAAQNFDADPAWQHGGGGAAATPAATFVPDGRPPHANTAVPAQPLTQDTLADRIKPEPNGALSFYTRNKDNKLVKSFLITPEGSLVAGGTLQNGPDVPLTSEPSMLHPSAYDNATNGARLSWVNDFFFGLNKSAGLGRMQSEGQPMLYLRVLGLMGRADSPDIQLGRAGPDNGRTNYGPLEATAPGNCLGKIIFKAYIKDPEKVEGEWTGDIAGIHARNETTPTAERSPASLHFTTAGDSVGGNAWRENVERMVIRSNGFVGIGDEFTQPKERLHVQGNIRASGDVVAGGAKKFVIPHPTQPGRQLAHAAVEGPEAAVYYRGEAQLAGGRAEVRLPDYFESLTAKQGRTVILTNVDGFDRLAVQRQRGMQVSGGRFVVVSDNRASTQAFSWEVKATRADVSPLEVEK